MLHVDDAQSQTMSKCQLYIAVHRSKSEDVKAVVPQFDAGFEDKLKELKQQGSQKLSVSFPHMSITFGDLTAS